MELIAAQIPLANGVVFLSNSLDYARSFDDFAGLELALGLEDFAVALPNGERA